MLRRSVIRVGVHSGNGVLGIRREDKNVWERRTPLVPLQVKELLEKNHASKVIVQPSTIRCFSDAEYQEAGAVIAEDLSECGTIVAVKEVPAQKLLDDRTYMFFSHTIKAQAYNMPLLDTIVRKNIRLIDYERIVGRDGRVVKFGPHAGYAGMVDTLHAVGKALLLRGYATPFVHLSLAKEYRSLEAARSDLLVTGDLIRKNGLPEDVSPLVFAITGAGSVSLSAQQILHCLPCKYVEVEDLPRLRARENKDRHHVYVCVVRAKDIARPKDRTATFSSEDYYANPSNYEGCFHERVAPYIDVLVTGHYWEPRFPRLLTIAQSQHLLRHDRFPLMVLSDITCDIGGSLEFFVKSTSIQNPFYAYDIEKEKVIDYQNYDGTGVLILGVDHLPAEFPREASTDFGSGLKPLMKTVLFSKAVTLAEQEKYLGKMLFDAVICTNGNITPNYEYISRLRQKNEAATQKKKRVLIVGGGMVAGPCVEQIISKQNTLTLVDSSQKALDSLVRNFAAHVTKPGLNAEENYDIRTSVADASKIDEYMESEISRSDVVVSLLPATMHPIIAECAIKHRVPMVTGSYVSPAMESLRSKAEQNNTFVVNEQGLDPGIDIMTSADLLARIRNEGGIVTKYVSLCGALPAPEHSNSPLGYKFSWFPRGVLTAASRPARFRAGGQWYDIPGTSLYNHALPITSFRGLDLYWVPNGNAEKYAALYNLSDADTDTVVRGTLRYSSFAPAIRAFLALGLLDESVTLEELRRGVPAVVSWPTVLRRVMKIDSSVDLENVLIQKIGSVVAQGRATHQEGAFQALRKANAVGNSIEPQPDSIEQEVSSIIDCFKSLSLLDDSSFVPKTGSGLLIDSLCVTMQHYMMYYSHERDFVLMLHRVTAKFPTGKTKVFTATLARRGESDVRTATAVTVGAPVGLTAQLILDGALSGKKGLVMTTDPCLYKPVLTKLAELGIKMHEKVEEI